MIHSPTSFASTGAHYQHVGAQLRDLRQHYGLSIAQVADRLHIRARYLEALERGDTAALPGRVYLQGYISSYAEFLGLTPKELLAHYGMASPAPTSAPPPLVGTVMPHSANTRTTRRAARWALALAALCVLAYAVWPPMQDTAGMREQASPRVAPVPAHLQTDTRVAPMLFLARSRTCFIPAEGNAAFMPCYYDEALEESLLATVAKQRSLMGVWP